ncbi:MAG: hypothetical protein C4530_13395 [Desulfobacteraceae bacterium]|nr:MAG: hypothetical protein C4530_13395 [Desulfobacteraceae bacterium]
MQAAESFIRNRVVLVTTDGMEKISTNKVFIVLFSSTLNVVWKIGWKFEELFCIPYKPKNTMSRKKIRFPILIFW